MRITTFMHDNIRHSVSASIDASAMTFFWLAAASMVLLGLLSALSG
ncbi:hypothetical protein [Tardiphaga sp. 42S5]|nr:hypothetical protein [Tardiphaga sp. 42S5]WPO42682.1 hypothetical protein SFY93_05890 [Tardiphaga sp. 42S5]